MRLFPPFFIERLTELIAFVTNLNTEEEGGGDGVGDSLIGDNLGIDCLDSLDLPFFIDDVIWGPKSFSRTCNCFLFLSRSDANLRKPYLISGAIFSFFFRIDSSSLNLLRTDIYSFFLESLISIQYGNNLYHRCAKETNSSVIQTIGIP